METTDKKDNYGFYLPTKDHYGSDLHVDQILLSIDTYNLNGLEDLAKCISECVCWIDYEDFFIHPTVLKKILDKYNK